MNHIEVFDAMKQRRFSEVQSVVNENPYVANVKDEVSQISIFRRLVSIEWLYSIVWGIIASMGCDQRRLGYGDIFAWKRSWYSFEGLRKHLTFLYRREITTLLLKIVRNVCNWSCNYSKFNSYCICLGELWCRLRKHKHGKSKTLLFSTVEKTHFMNFYIAREHCSSFSM